MGIREIVPIVILNKSKVKQLQCTVIWGFAKLEKFSSSIMHNKQAFHVCLITQYIALTEVKTQYFSPDKTPRRFEIDQQTPNTVATELCHSGFRAGLVQANHQLTLKNCIPFLESE